MTHEDRRDNGSPMLPLAGGDAIYCGPENSLLRHTVEQIFGALKSNSELDPTWIPLVLYGESLSGKSLVARCLADTWKQEHPKRSSAVLTAADLTRMFGRNDVSEGVERTTTAAKKASLVVVEDVQRLAGKHNAESWLASLLDYRSRYFLPTIVTSNCVIAKTKLNERLRGRLSTGLSIGISLPYAATRKDVILHSAQAFGLSLPDAEVDQLVQTTSGTTVSGIHSVVASVASNCQPTLQARPDFATDGDGLIQKLIRTTARRFGVKVADVKGPSRRKNTVLARAIAMFLVREVTPLSLQEIGKHFRNRDHTTVRHACEKIKSQLAEDESMQEAVRAICSSLNIRLPSSWFDLLNGKCA